MVNVDKPHKQKLFEIVIISKSVKTHPETKSLRTATIKYCISSRYFYFVSLTFFKKMKYDMMKKDACFLWKI